MLDGERYDRLDGAAARPCARRGRRRPGAPPRGRLIIESGRAAASLEDAYLELVAATSRSRREPPRTLAAAALAQAAVELRLTARRGENLLAMVGIPVAVLLFFGGTSAPAGTDRAIPADVLAARARWRWRSSRSGPRQPRDRHGLRARVRRAQAARRVAAGSGRLDRAPRSLRSSSSRSSCGPADRRSPPSRWAGGPAPAGSPAGFAAAFVLGSAAFAGLGLLLAGTLRAEATLALANVLFVGSLLVGGVIVPVDRLPGPFAAVAGLLPAGAVSEAFRASLGAGGDLARPIAILAVWAAVAVLAAARTFRWE